MASPGEKKGEEGHGGYLVTDENGKGHLPTRRDGKLDHGLLGAAHAALFSPSGYRGKPYEGPGKEEAKSKLRALYKEAGLDWPSETSSECPRQVFELSDLAGKSARIPIAVTGEWVKAGRKFAITPEKLAEIKSNFERRQVPINVDYDHASENPEVALGGPIPSAGELTALEGPEAYT